ncbi:hypothetical protein TL16_g13355, partial [Triparma laevis f. inornata]
EGRREGKVGEVEVEVPELFLPGDYIFRQGDAAQKLYMIQSGTVEIVDSQGNHLVTLKEGKYFGEVSLLTDLRRTASAKATSYCTTDTLSKKSFNEIREQFEEFNDSIVEMCETNEYKFNTEDDLDNEDDLDSVNRQNSYTKSVANRIKAVVWANFITDERVDNGFVDCRYCHSVFTNLV